MAEIRATLEAAGVGSARREAGWLLEAATGRSGSDTTALTDDLPEMTERRALRLAARRAAGEPLQYITGVAGFRRLELEVGPGVFIPRPETELVAESAMSRLPRGGTLVDVGTGSGAIALSVADERPDASVFATEGSRDALAWAEKNRDRLQLDVELVSCDLLSGLPKHLAGRIDVVVSNPPYIAPGEMDALPTDVVDHEPHQALFAGMEGRSVLERIAREARRWLAVGGWLIMEVGATQGPRTVQALEHLGYRDVGVSPDLAGRDRIAEGRHG